MDNHVVPVKTSNNVELKFAVGGDEKAPPTDPQSHPVVIIGQLVNLKKLSFSRIRNRLEPRVSEDVFNSALLALHSSTADAISLYLNYATVCSLPSKSSRHNSTARPHSLANLLRNASSGVTETVIIVCPFADVVASVCAIARSYPIYSRKTQSTGGGVVGGGGGGGAVSPKPPVIVNVEIILSEKLDGVSANIDESLDLHALEVLAAGVRQCARIVDAPCSEMNVAQFLKEIKAVADQSHLELTVIERDELKKRGMNGIYSVGKAALSGPALAVLTYDPQKHNNGDAACDKLPTVAWVGKGIVYDTGGLSLKTKTMMPGMKRDCGGAAAVLSAMSVAGQLGVKNKLSAVFCLAENTVGPSATRPDDIEVLYSGRSVEINNTDAEGRLVLADGVVYAAKDLKADVILDMATLTGAQAIATGKYHGALLTNSPTWESLAFQCSKLSGDLLFPIPFCPELHFVEFNSSMADMKNSVNDRANAQSSCAGLFVMAHLGFDFPGTWLHVDMASPVHSGERATGYGVALLTVLFGQFSRNRMFNKMYEMASK